jgi:hypothetical protein
VKVQKSQVGSVSGGINAVSGLNTLTYSWGGENLLYYLETGDFNNKYNL